MNELTKVEQHRTTREALDAGDYQAGFGNEFQTEAVAGALPRGQNSPQKPPLGLYSELFSGTAFYTPRHLNRRSYVFRIRPSVISAEFKPWDSGNFRTPPLDVPPYPNRLRWGPRPEEGEPADFLEGLLTICGAGSPDLQEGVAVHFFRATRSMKNRAFANADGEFIIVPQQGDLRVVTEFGVLDVQPSELVLIPRGIKFRVELKGTFARGLVFENYGHPWVLPDLGLIGSYGLANAHDFQAPVASFEDEDVRTQFIQKMGGKLWSVDIGYSPFDVVAWRGTLTPFKYDMNKFVGIGTATVDFLDPSTHCALTSPGHKMNGCNADLLIFGPRWIVGEQLREPGFHRSCATEISSVVVGMDAIGGQDPNKAWPPGSIRITNNWGSHGPEASNYERSREGNLDPIYVAGAINVAIECRFPMQFTQAAMDLKERHSTAIPDWSGYVKRFPDG